VGVDRDGRTRDGYPAGGEGGGGAAPHPPGGGHGGSGPIGLGEAHDDADSTSASVTAPTIHTSLFDMIDLLTGTSSLAALVALAVHARDRAALGILTTFATAMTLLVLFRPALWSPEVFVFSESGLALLCVVVALAAARRAMGPQEALWAALFLAGAAGVGGWIALRFVPLIANFAYRGAAFVDLAAAAVLATVASRSVIVDRLDSVAVRWLALVCGLSALRLLMFEFHFGFGRFLGWLQAFAWCGCMFLIAWQALRGADRSSSARGWWAG
jgi:hypothetical protein